MTLQLQLDADPIAHRLDDDGGGDIRGDATRVVFDYWQALRRGRRFPDWPDVELMELWSVAANVAVLDVLDGGNDFLHRYWGSRLAEASDGDFTGRRCSEILGDNREIGTINFRRVARTGEPVLSYRRLSFLGNRDHIVFEGVHLPLGPDGGPVTQVFSGFDFDCNIDDILGTSA